MAKRGRCNCGEIHFVVEGEPERMALCHCDACRRATGTGHNVQAFFRKDQVEITGTPSAYEWTADSGNTRKWLFCPKCGSRLFGENSRAPDMVGIAAGAFEDSSWFKPQFIVCSGQRPDWDMVDPAIEVRS